MRAEHLGKRLCDRAMTSQHVKYTVLAGGNGHKLQASRSYFATLM